MKKFLLGLYLGGLCVHFLFAFVAFGWEQQLTLEQFGRILLYSACWPVTIGYLVYLLLGGQPI